MVFVAGGEAKENLAKGPMETRATGGSGRPVAAEIEIDEGKEGGATARPYVQPVKVSSRWGWFYASRRQVR